VGYADIRPEERRREGERLRRWRESSWDPSALGSSGRRLVAGQECGGIVGCDDLQDGYCGWTAPVFGEITLCLNYGRGWLIRFLFAVQAWIRTHLCQVCLEIL